MHDGIDQNNDKDKIKLAIKEKQLNISPEGSETIHVAVINQGQDEEYMDILVKGVPEDWTMIEKPVVHVHPGEAEQFTVTVQPPAVSQSRVGQYPLEVQAVSQRDYQLYASAHSILTVAAYQSQGRIGVMLGSIYFSVAPGSSITIPILLHNRGTQEDSFGLSVNGIPANWVSTNAAYTDLKPNMSKEIQLSIRVPRASTAAAGRNPFKIQFTSQKYPDQRSEVECILTISTFSNFTVSMEPKELNAGEFGNLVIDNQGNTPDTYALNFQSSGSLLLFEKAVTVETGTEQPGSQKNSKALLYEIPAGERVQVEAGRRGIYPFRGRLRSRPIAGGEKQYPFTVDVTSTDKKSVELSGEVSEKGFVPGWIFPSILVGFLAICLLALFPFTGLRNAARATQTAQYNLTQAALSAQGDSDGDGLTNAEEIQLGTDSLNPDTDGDGLTDGEESHQYMTNPLVSDTDGDGLLDGEEIQYGTDPLVPDTDGDGLNDGAEIAAGTNPLIADTDQDGLNDGVEVNLGTDPLQPDTDKDGLLDGQENETCPRPLIPDSDSDGIIDGNDLDPCNALNPSLTATAVAGSTQPVTVIPPTNIVAPTATLIPTGIVPTPTQQLPTGLTGIILFESNRSGNSEIFATNLENGSTLQLTNNSAVDTQPALAPDSLRVAYVSNQSGNNEIYLTGLDRRAPVNLTNNPADDQNPVWSPDGNWIAFTSNRDGNQEIYIMRSDGSEAHSLTNNPANDFDPTWFSVPHLLSTDEWIAFTSTRDGNLEIYKIRPDGTDLENITKNPANDYSPAGIPKMAMLTFVTDRDGNPEVYTMTDSGGALTNVTNNSAQDLDPSMGSNGDYLIFTSDRDGNLEIYLSNLVGSEIYNLTRNPAQDRYPDW